MAAEISRQHLRIKIWPQNLAINMAAEISRQHFRIKIWLPKSRHKHSRQYLPTALTHEKYGCQNRARAEVRARNIATGVTGEQQFAQ